MKHFAPICLLRGEGGNLCSSLQIPFQIDDVRLQQQQQQRSLAELISSTFAYVGAIDGA